MSNHSSLFAVPAQPKKKGVGDIHDRLPHREPLCNAFNFPDTQPQGVPLIIRFHLLVKPLPTQLIQSPLPIRLNLLPLPMQPIRQPFCSCLGIQSIHFFPIVVLDSPESFMIAEDTVLAFVKFYSANGGAAAALNWYGPLGVDAADAHGEVLCVTAAGADVGVNVAHGPRGVYVGESVVFWWEEYLGQSNGCSRRLRT